MLRILSSVHSAAPVSARFFSACAVAPSKKIFVGNWPFAGTQTQLEEMFGEFGQLEEAKVPTTYEGHPRGFAFVTFTKEEAGQEAIAALDGKLVNDRNIRVTPSVPRDPNAPRPPRFNGGGEQRFNDNRREGYSPRRDEGGFQRREGGGFQRRGRDEQFGRDF